MKKNMQPIKKITKIGPPTLKVRSLKIAILVDPMGCMDAEPEDEIETHKETMRRLFPKHTLTFERLYCIDDQKLTADIVLFDFGGMMPGNDLLGDNSRRLIRWAQDHSSSLALVMSSFTYRHGLLPELLELGIIPDDGEYEHKLRMSNSAPPIDALPNIMAYEGWDEKIETKIQGWFE